MSHPKGMKRLKALEDHQEHPKAEVQPVALRAWWGSWGVLGKCWWVGGVGVRRTP